MNEIKFLEKCVLVGLKRKKAVPDGDVELRFDEFRGQLVIFAFGIMFTGKDLEEIIGKMQKELADKALNHMMNYNGFMNEK